MRRLVGAMLLVLGTSAVLVAGTAPCSACVVHVPEIDPTTGLAAVALLTGAALIVRGRRRKSGLGSLK